MDLDVIKLAQYDLCNLQPIKIYGKIQDNLFLLCFRYNKTNIKDFLNVVPT